MGIFLLVPALFRIVIGIPGLVSALVEGVFKPLVFFLVISWVLIVLLIISGIISFSAVRLWSEGIPIVSSGVWSLGLVRIRPRPRRLT